MRFVDLTSRTFGRLTVTRRVENRGRHVYWACRCTCGALTEVKGDHLKSGATRSCGCAFTGSLLVDLTGQRFSRMTVLRRAPNRGHHVYWVCCCDCGNLREVAGEHLKSGRTASCGCLKIERTIAANTRHGHARATTVGQSPTYRSWGDMIKRTTNPRTRRWSDYGGRGITVCDRWRSFVNFLTDMGERPSGLTLDRIDNDGNYEPGNCRWATPTQQAQNRRKRTVAAS